MESKHFVPIHPHCIRVAISCGCEARRLRILFLTYFSFRKMAAVFARILVLSSYPPSNERAAFVKLGVKCDEDSNWSPYHTMPRIRMASLLQDPVQCSFRLWNFSSVEYSGFPGPLPLLRFHVMRCLNLDQFTVVEK